MTPAQERLYKYIQEISSLDDITLAIFVGGKIMIDVKEGYYFVPNNINPIYVYHITPHHVRSCYLNAGNRQWVQVAKKNMPAKRVLLAGTFSDTDPTTDIYAKFNSLRGRAEKILGCVDGWERSNTCMRMHTSSDIKLADIIKLSEEFGTDAINFNFGHEGEPGYSEYTPSSPGSPGYIEIYFPVK